MSRRQVSESRSGVELTGRMDPESPVFNDTAHVDEHRLVWTPSTLQADGSSFRYSTPDDTRKR
jgi:hypothetical protein